MINLGLAIFSAFEAVLIVRTLGLGSTGLGVVTSAGALGALIGASLAVPLGTRLGQSRVALGAGAGLPVAATLTLTALIFPAQALIWLVAGAFAWGAAIVSYNVHAAGITARLTSPAALGRVSATRRTLTMGIVPAGSILGGMLADYAGMFIAVATWIGLTAAGATIVIRALGRSPE